MSNPFEVKPEIELRAALTRLGLDSKTAARGIEAMLSWLNGVASAKALVADIGKHPLPAAPGTRAPRQPSLRAGTAAPAAPTLMADALIAARPFGDVLEVAVVSGVDAAVLAQLIHVGHELAAPPPPPPPPPTVGVLVPLRLETRFAPPQGLAGWKLRVRIIPDVVSLNGHDPLAKEAELSAVEAMWRNCSGDISTDQGQAEWRAFSARVGAGRAAWLARTFPPVVVGGEITITRPAQVRGEPLVSRIAGLPPQLELWLARGGGAPAKAATVTIDLTQLTTDLPDPTTGEERWWSSFAKAQAVGLATEIDLGLQADDIDVVYVVGLGGGDPAPLFQSHRDRGALAVLPLGTPTNAVDGEPAADLAADPETWRRLVVGGGAVQTGSQQVSNALTGQADALAPLPGGEASSLDAGQAMVRALWPSVFGNGLRNLWSVGDGAYDIGLWALDNLVPEGPVPPVRIGDQPYGILPVSSLAAWRPAEDDPVVEEQVRPELLQLLADWAAAGEAGGTAVGADTDLLLDLLGRTPSSPGYSWRWFLPLELLHPLGWGFGGGVRWNDAVGWWNVNAGRVLQFPITPTRRYGTLAHPQDVAIPLVEPDNLPADQTLPDALALLLQLPPGALVNPGQVRERFPRLPNSLLFRLLLFSLVIGAAEVARARAGVRGPLLEPPYVANTVASELAGWVVQMDPNQLPAHPAGAVWSAVHKGAGALLAFDAPTLERVLRATLDTAAYRLDPWITGMAWRRLRSLTAPHFELGAYGWVDAPRPTGGTTFTPEILHAPSEAQALTAAILRDRSLSDQEPERWHMDLTSEKVRLADQLAVEVRMGAHLCEVLGRAVERVVATPADVERLRRDFPIRTEHAGRRVCDGERVLDTLITKPGDLGLSQPVLDALAPLAGVVDVYGDLLVADATFDVVSGRAETASASMEAAAGLSAPPVLDVIRTQRRGRSVSTSVVIALPGVAGPAIVDATTSPGRIADPSVAAFLDTVFGTATSSAWTWHVLHPDGATITPVTLDDLGLAPVDTAALSSDDLARAVLAASAAPEGSEVAPSGGLDAHVRVTRVVTVLGTQPALGAHLADDGSSPDSAPILTDLADRYGRLVTAADAMLAALQSAATGTEPAQRAALGHALRWGITPMDRDEPTLTTLVTRARDAMAARLQAAPDAAGLGAAELARAVAELASPEGRLPVLAHHQLDELPVALTPDATRPALDPDWLEVVASVRLPVARLEAFQFEQRAVGGSPLARWTNRPGDPWQASVPAGSVEGLIAPTRLVAAFGPPGTLDPGSDPARAVAIGLLDSWGETIPATAHATTAAFHFDAPGSRPPQAILVAVPPDLSRPLDTATIAGIVAETRTLARARAAIPARLDAYAAALPLTVLPFNPPAGVSLEPA